MTKKLLLSSVILSALGFFFVWPWALIPALWAWSFFKPDSLRLFFRLQEKAAEKVSHALFVLLFSIIYALVILPYGLCFSARRRMRPDRDALSNWRIPAKKRILFKETF